ncbi:MAG: M23 family metallopeptidase [Lachnospiraceae bacterium]|nr:M23 family metallopeptidase [Lachnospiraceae bacterium]
MKRYLHYVLFLFFLVGSSVWLSRVLYQQSVALQLSWVKPESDPFREQRLNEKSLAALLSLTQQTQMQPGEIMTVLAHVRKVSNAGKSGELTAAASLKWKYLMLKYNRSGYEALNEAYGAIWNDIQCFPVASEEIVYENSWMFERTYGGKRGHEGVDLMPPENIPGHYPIVSMTDGVVEKIGWLPKGGYRIGIRSPSGGYFYYAHLNEYSRAFQAGDVVSAGTVLGTMGDTGYGPEGTRGKFDVHLHLGIYIRTEDTPELSVNPYWVLRYCSQKTAKGCVASSG